nr:lipoprotein signal peptidase [Neisseria sp. HSC-16F19]
MRRISALCAARLLAYLFDMSALTVLLRLELHPGCLKNRITAWNQRNDQPTPPPDAAILRSR